MKRLIFFPAALVLLLGMLLLVETGASATMRYARPGNPFKAIPVAGVVNDDQKYKGTMEITEFSSSDDDLVASVKIEGKTYNENGEESGEFHGAFTSVPAFVRATCQSLKVTIKGLEKRNSYYSAKINPATVTVSSDQRPDLRDLFCSIAEQLKHKKSQGDVADTLNDVIARFG